MSRYKGRIRKYQLNDAFFDGSVLSCYWAGFIAADGCIVDQHGQHAVRIKVSEKDCPHLECFCLDAGSDSPVHSSKEGYCYVSLHSAQWVRTLAQRFHITPRKSYTLRSPVGLSRDQELAFIAGLIDGDGCISYDRCNQTTRLDICGTEAMMDWVRKTIRACCPERCNYTVRFYKSGLARWVMAARSARWLKAQVEVMDLPLMERKWGVLN